MPERIDTTATRGTDAAFGDGGLTKREWFSAVALEGLLSAMPDRFNTAADEAQWLKHLPSGAVMLADALIEALNKDVPRG